KAAVASANSALVQTRTNRCRRAKRPFIRAIPCSNCQPQSYRVRITVWREREWVGRALAELAQQMDRRPARERGREFRALVPVPGLLAQQMDQRQAALAQAS